MRWLLAIVVARYLVRQAKEAVMPQTTLERISELKVRATMLMNRTDWNAINLAEVEHLIMSVHQLPSHRERDVLQDALLGFHKSLRESRTANETIGDLLKMANRKE